MNVCHILSLPWATRAAAVSIIKVGRDRNWNADSFDEQNDKDGGQAVLYQKEVQAMHIDMSIRLFNLFCIKYGKRALLDYFIVRTFHKSFPH